MELDETRWLKIQAYASVKGRTAPKAVVVALASVIGDTDRATIWPSMEGAASSTTWSCWVVTERSVGHVEIEYEKRLYDQGAEAQREFIPSAWSAWVRPLADITELRFGPPYASQRKPTVFEPSEPITVKFTDSCQISIPEEGPILVDDRPHADAIIKALRAGVHF